MWYWKLALIGRKLVLALTGILLSYDPTLQAGVALAVLFGSYIAQQRLRPFVELDGIISSASISRSRERVSDTSPEDMLRVSESVSRSMSTSGSTSLSAVDAALLSRSLIQKGGWARHVPSWLTNSNYNALEATFLTAAVLVLVAGMMFLSGGFAPQSTGSTVLAWFVAAVVIGSTAWFVTLVVVEVVQSIANHQRHLAERQAEAERLEAAMMPHLAAKRRAGAGERKRKSTFTAIAAGVRGKGQTRAALRLLGASARSAGRRVTRLLGAVGGDSDAASSGPGGTPPSQGRRRGLFGRGLGDLLAVFQRRSTASGSGIGRAAGATGTPVSDRDDPDDPQWQAIDGNNAAAGVDSDSEAKQSVVAGAASANDAASGSVGVPSRQRTHVLSFVATNQLQLGSRRVSNAPSGGPGALAQFSQSTSPHARHGGAAGASAEVTVDTASGDVGSEARTGSAAHPSMVSSLLAFRSPQLPLQSQPLVMPVGVPRNSVTMPVSTEPVVATGSERTGPPSRPSLANVRRRVSRMLARRTSGSFRLKPGSSSSTLGIGSG